MSDNPLKGPSPTDFFNWIGQYVQPMMENSLKAMSQMSANTPQPAIPPMVSATPADPFTLWRSFYDQNEQVWAKFMQQFVATPEFAAGLGSVASQQATLQNNVRQTALSYLKAAHMPSQDDITRVAALVVALDAKVDDLQDNLDELLLKPSVQTAPAAKNNDERIVALESRLATIEGKLDRLLAALENQAAPPTKPNPAPGRRSQAKTPPLPVFKGKDKSEEAL